MKEFVFGFKLAAALEGNFKTAFSSASNQMLKLNEKMQQHQQIAQACSSAVKQHTLRVESYNNALNKLYASYQKVNDNAQRYAAIQGRTNQRRTAMGQNESSAFSLAGMAYGFAAPLKQAVKFESAMSDVRKVVDFDSDDQFAQMNKDILALSKSIPMTAEGLAAIVAAGGQAGIARKDLLEFAKASAKMGIAFDVTAEEAGDMMAKWRTAFKMNQAEVVTLADKINYLSNKTAASAPLISDVVTRIGPLGEVGGVASGEIAALGASLVGSGINSEIAATGIKNLILTMVSGESATKDQKTAFAALGFESAEMAKRMQKDAKGAILDVLKALNALDKDKQGATLQRLFGKESIGAIAPLLSNLEGLEKNLRMVANEEEYAGSMQGEFDTKAQTTANQLSLMKNEFIAVETEIGNGMIPVFRNLLAGVTPAAKMFSNFASQNSSLVGSMLLTGAGLATLGATFNALAWVGNGLMLAINGIKGALVATHIWLIKNEVAAKASVIATKIWTAAQMAGAAAQWTLNSALFACPIAWVAAALVAAGYLIYTNWDTLKAFFVTLWDDPQVALQQFIDGVKNKFQEAYAWIMEKWGAIKNFISTPIFGNVNISAQGNGTIAHNASGGIYGKGAFLTTFAENSGESAIPHTPNAHNIGLLAETNRIMGNPLGGGSINATFAPNITVNGGNADQIQDVLENEMAKFKQMLAELQNQQRRLSYA